MPLGKAPCRGPSVTLDCVEAGELAEVVDGEGGKREMVLVLALLFPVSGLELLLLSIGGLELLLLFPAGGLELLSGLILRVGGIVG